MSYCVDSAVMREIDRITIEEVGIPGGVLMERAALCVAETVRTDYSDRCTICVVYGPGNNGGDGIAVARIMSLWGYRCVIVPAADELHMSPLEIMEYEAAIRCGVREAGRDELATVLGARDCVCVDAIFGIGLERAITGQFADTVRVINASGATVYSVDTPSGISADGRAAGLDIVHADVTITFGYAKHGLIMYPGAEYAGKVVTADAGFAIGPADGRLKKAGRISTYYTCSDEVHMPVRFAESNKGSYGKVLFIGGSEGAAGAGYLAAAGAYLSGAGLVKTLTAEAAAELINNKLPEAMTGVLFTGSGIDADILQSSIEWATVIVIGPGLGTGSDAKTVFEKVLTSGKKMIVDADALNILAKLTDLAATDKIISRSGIIADFFSGEAILTPHMGEMSRLTGLSVESLKKDVLKAAEEYTYGNRLTYIIKDARTVVAHEGATHINVSGNNGMSTGGSGDVLAGITAGMAAAGLEMYDAAKTAVYLHSAAGDMAAREKGVDSLIASDLLKFLPEVIRAVREGRQ